MRYIIVGPYSPLNITKKYLVVNNKRWLAYCQNPIPGGFPSYVEFDSYAQARVKRNRLNGRDDD